MSSNDDQIAQAERHFGVRLPEDYRHFLATEGSMARFVPPADDFLMINAIAEIIEVNVRRPRPRARPRHPTAESA